jgi:lysophospholipase
MIQINTDPYPEIVAQSLIGAAVLAGKGKDRRLFDKPGPDTFEDNISTHSRTRWDIAHDLGVADPSIRLDYATNKWVHEVFNMTNSVRHNKTVVTVPVLLLQAEADEYVINAAQSKLCARWAHCETEVIHNAKHALLEESDVIRDEALTHIESFISRQ